MLSLPYLLGLFGKDDYHLPSSIRLASDKLNHGAWKRGRPRVAINWQGNTEAESPTATHRERSLTLADYEALHSLQQVDLVCVQHGPAAQQIKTSCLSHRLIDQSLEQGDFLALASALIKCDILITNDTSVAHLGGLVGVETWVALKRFPSWQWGYSGWSNLWYPSIRCFRQSRSFDWSSVIQMMDSRLSQML
jgi:hypothetical protein